MLLTLRPDGEPQLLVVGRGFYRPLFINVTPPKITEADRDQRLRTRTDVVNSHDVYFKYVKGVETTLAHLRQVIVGLGLNGHDVAAFVSKIVDQIDGRSLDGAPGEAPARGYVSGDDDDGDARLGPCPEGVDEDAWAAVRKDVEGNAFARFARLNDFAARVRSMVGNFRAAGPVKKCGNNAPAPAPAVVVPAPAPAAPGPGPAPAPAPAAARPKPKRGRLADGLPQVLFKFGPLEPDWASKVELGAKPVATIDPDDPDELLVEFWLRVSRPMAEALHQEFEVLSERDAPADNISPLLDAVAGVVGKRKAPDAVAAPGAKRARDAVAPA